MKDPKFTVDDIRSVSTAGAGLLKWVFAMVNYYRCTTHRLDTPPVFEMLRTQLLFLCDCRELAAYLFCQAV